MVSRLQHVSDFANLFKAFIGSNYLSMPFAFKQSGLALGIGLLLVIAVITDHCCYLIVKCKQLMVESLCEDDASAAASIAPPESVAPLPPTESFYDNDGYTPDSAGPPGAYSATAPDEAPLEMDPRADELHRVVTLGDIAKFTFGRPGLYLVNAALFITQFGFCINYFIFIGNTLHQVLSLGLNETSSASAAAAADLLDTYRDALDDVDLSAQQPADGAAAAASLMPHPPALWLLVCTPLPLFLGFALIRNIRSMGSVSVVANLSICAGVVAVLALMLHGFQLNDTVVQAKASTLPVYIGMVAVSYEGIGTVIPIESSMEGNRHNFRAFLRGTLLVVTGILGGVGAIGYLRYGKDTEQILVQNLPTQSVFVVVLDATLILGVIFTFPLQIFPVIQMIENFCLSRYSASPEEQESLITSTSVQADDVAANGDSGGGGGSDFTASAAPDAAPAWLRNCLRFGIVLCQLAMAILLRDLYAYVSSFVGAVGSIFLAFILPCAAHLRLIWPQPGARLVKLKDACICFTGCLASATSIFVTVVTIVAPHFFDRSMSS